jgi:D-serine deaminase-like pyridoxal phosphate-dependent protein
MNVPWYTVANAGEIDSPALLVFPELGIDKFKCATVAEAEMVALAGGKDIVLAYHLVGPRIDRFCELMRKYPDTSFAALADDEPTVRAISQQSVAAPLPRPLALLLDIDTGFGRTGIPAGEQAKAIYRLFADLPGIEPGGFHVYDGQYRQRDLGERTAASDAAFAPAQQLRRELEAEGLPVPRVVAGGTPTFPIHARRPDVECSPGTCIYWDASYADKFPDLDFLHAAVLLTRVISKPGGRRVCLDLGYKAVSADNPDPRAVFLNLPDAKAVIHNEEHLAIDTSRAESLAVGDVLYAIPFHVCPTVALHEHVIVVQGGRAAGRWKVTARDRVIFV